MPTDSTKEQNKLRATLLRQIDQMPTLEAKKKDHLCQAITQTDHFALLLTISFETATTKITQQRAQKSRVFARGGSSKFSFITLARHHAFMYNI